MLASSRRTRARSESAAARMGSRARCEHRIADLERPPEGRRFGHPAELVPLPSQLGGKERLEARALARELRARLRLPRQRSGECRLGGVEPGPDGGVRRGQDPGARVNAPFRGQQVCPHLSIGNRGNSVVEGVDQRRGSLLDGGGRRQQTRRASANAGAVNPSSVSTGHAATRRSAWSSRRGPDSWVSPGPGSPLTIRPGTCTNARL